MLLYYTCLMLFIITRGEDNFIRRDDSNTFYYDTHPVIYQYLPSTRIPPEDNNPLLKVHDLTKGYGVQQPHTENHPLLYGNPLLTALLISTILGVPPIKYQGFNHQDQGPTNPYITLLLSQYGRYLPIHSLEKKGLYYYAASNNYHNNKPFGAYKVHEDTK